MIAGADARVCEGVRGHSLVVIKGEFGRLPLEDRDIAEAEEGRCVERAEAGDHIGGCSNRRTRGTLDDGERGASRSGGTYGRADRSALVR